MASTVEAFSAASAEGDEAAADRREQKALIRDVAGIVRKSGTSGEFKTRRELLDGDLARCYGLSFLRRSTNGRSGEADRDSDLGFILDRILGPFAANAGGEPRI
ncbi:MAG: hypothetical protein CVV47_17070 [Spirochaetae bacterium HGW-Spirochaetae-3]|nr:MAG: hypothetical protein CVV47_17070 [Spirochaetae bacterium HGW-Spirochaetae-3]